MTSIISYDQNDLCAKCVNKEHTLKEHQALRRKLYMKEYQYMKSAEKVSFRKNINRKQIKDLKTLEEFLDNAVF